MSVLVPVVEEWDGENRYIKLKTGVTEFHWIEDIYEEYRYERRTNEDFRKWRPFMVAAGNIAKGGNKFTPRFLTLLNDAKVVPFDEVGVITLTTLGECITDNPDVNPSPFYLDELTTPIQIFITPSESEIILINSGGGSGDIQTELATYGVAKVSDVINASQL